MDDKNLLGLLRRWWPWLVCGALVGGLAGAAATSRITPEYTATVKLLVGPINTDYDTIRASGQLARTYAELATSRPVLRYAIKRTGIRLPPAELQESGAVRAQSNDVTRVVTINVEYHNRRTAAELANRIAERVAALAALTPPRDSASIERLLNRPEIARLSPGARAAVATAANRALGSSLAGEAQVVESAQPPSNPKSSRGTLLTIVAGLMGMLAAAVVVVLRESSLEGVSDDRSLTALGEPPFLGRLDVPVSRSGTPDLALDVGPATLVEAYRGIATKLGFLDDQPRVRVLCVVDASDGKQSGVLAANLATVLADTQRRVLLIDANDVTPTATSALALDGRPGYAELIRGRGEVKLKEIALSRLDDFPTLSVLPRGTTATTGMLDEDYARRLLSRLQGGFHVIILSTAPVHLSTGALLWGRVADGTLLVVEAGRTTDERVQETVGSLGFVGANLVGTVLGRRRRARRSPRSTSSTTDGSVPTE